jgi:hypothetical protein
MADQTTRLSHDVLRRTLRLTTTWVSRLVCRAWWRVVERAPADTKTAVTSVERYRWAKRALGLSKRLACVAAATTGAWDVLSLAFCRPGQVLVRAVLRAAATHGHVDVIIGAIAWAREWSRGCMYGLRGYEAVCLAAARAGQLDVLEWALRASSIPNWALTYGQPGASRVLEAAATAGQVGVLAWLLTKGFVQDDDHPVARQLMAQHAALSGHRNVIEWILTTETAGSLGSKVGELAAAGGHLELLRFLREREFTLDASVCYAAAKSGHLHILQWARSVGCPWVDEDLPRPLFLYFVAATCDHVHIMQWADSNGCPWTSTGREALIKHSAVGQAARRWLRGPVPALARLRKRKRDV